jgi:DNA-binding CsgD family transcriptional regulator
VGVSFPTDLPEEHKAIDRVVARLEAEYAEGLPPFTLSKQAQDVLELLRRRTSNTKIAKRLSISEGVLQSHINAIVNCPQIHDRMRFANRSDKTDEDDEFKGQLNIGTMFSIQNVSHIEKFLVADLDLVDFDIFFAVFDGYIGNKPDEDYKLRIPTKAATYSNLIAATIPI